MVELFGSFVTLYAQWTDLGTNVESTQWPKAFRPFENSLIGMIFYGKTEGHDSNTCPD